MDTPIPHPYNGPPLHWMQSNDVGAVVHHSSRDPFELLAARDAVRARLNATERARNEARDRLDALKRDLHATEGEHIAARAAWQRLAQSNDTGKRLEAQRYVRTLLLQRADIDRLRSSIAVERDAYYLLMKRARELRSAGEGLRGLVVHYVTPAHLRTANRASDPWLFNDGSHYA